MSWSSRPRWWWRSRWCYGSRWLLVRSIHPVAGKWVFIPVPKTGKRSGPATPPGSSPQTPLASLGLCRSRFRRCGSGPRQGRTPSVWVISIPSWPLGAMSMARCFRVCVVPGCGDGTCSLRWCCPSRPTRRVLPFTRRYSTLPCIPRCWVRLPTPTQTSTAAGSGRWCCRLRLTGWWCMPAGRAWRGYDSPRPLMVVVYRWSWPTRLGCRCCRWGPWSAGPFPHNNRCSWPPVTTITVMDLACSVWTGHPWFCPPTPPPSGSDRYG